MTDQEINTAIAEWMGWIRQPMYDYTSDDKKVQVWQYDCKLHHAIPDFCHDLNAMHEAEEKLNDKQYSTFSYNLCRIRNEVCIPTCRCRSAKASERAEALLRTINQWKG